MSIIPLLALVFAVVGLILLWTGIRGVPEFGEPRCARCRYDLRGFAQEVARVCSECGADLTRPGAVRFGDYRRRPRRIFGGLGLIVLPVLMIVSMVFLQVRRGPMGRGVQSNAQLIAALATTADQPWDWNELRDRYRVGKLSAAEACASIDQLIAFLNAKRAAGKPRTGPLSWSEDFVKTLDNAKVIPDEQFSRLVDAFYGPTPTVKLNARVRQGQPVRFEVKYAEGGWDLPNVEVVYAMNGVKWEDGRTIVCATDSDLRNKNPDLLSGNRHWGIDGSLIPDAPPGNHQLTFVVDTAALVAGTTPRMQNNKPGQATNWPRGRARQTREIVVPVTVVAPGESTVKMVTDPDLDPQKRGGVTIKDIKITRVVSSLNVAANIEARNIAIPMSFDVVMLCDGKEYPAGSAAFPGPNQNYGTSTQVPSLPPTLRIVEVMLRPNPVYAERIPGLDRAWGGELRFRNFSVSRYDLEADAANTTQQGVMREEAAK